MFEGNNTITLSDAAANSLFSSFLTQKFGVEIEVSSVKKDYHGLSVEFTETNTKDKEKSHDSDNRNPEA